MSRMTPATELEDVGRSAISRAAKRLVPLLVLIYFLNFLDRVNIGYASLTMNKDLGLSATAYGLGAGLFFVGYFLFEVPSNLILHRVGARIWIARIMLSWGIVSALTGLVQNEAQFYIVRFLLGFAEAGLFPGIILYLTYWFPARDRARITAIFLLGLPLSAVLGAPLSTAILQNAHGWFGLEGWRLLFFIEGIPSLIVGVVVLFYLTDRPAKAHWMPEREKQWLTDTLQKEEAAASESGISVLRAFANTKVVLLSIAYFGIVYGVYALSFFLPQLVAGLSGSFGTKFTYIQVGLIVAIPFAFGAVAMWLVGRHSDKSGERYLHIAIPSFVAAVGLILSLLVADSPYVLLIGLILLTMGVFGSIPAFWAVPPKFLAGAALAGGIGLINSFGNLSGFVGPYITGWLKDSTGDFRMGLIIVAAFMAVAGVIALILRRSDSREGAQR